MRCSQHCNRNAGHQNGMDQNTHQHGNLVHCIARGSETWLLLRSHKMLKCGNLAAEATKCGRIALSLKRNDGAYDTGGSDA
jgi:hypothetical protein